MAKKIVLAIWSPLKFCVNFLDGFFYFCRNHHWDCSESVDRFGQCEHLNNIVFQFMNTRCVSCMSSLISFSNVLSFSLCKSFSS